MRLTGRRVTSPTTASCTNTRPFAYLGFLFCCGGGRDGGLDHRPFVVRIRTLRLRDWFRMAMLGLLKPLHNRGEPIGALVFVVVDQRPFLFGPVHSCH